MRRWFCLHRRVAASRRELVGPGLLELALARAALLLLWLLEGYFGARDSCGGSHRLVLLIHIAVVVSSRDREWYTGLEVFALDLACMTARGRRHLLFDWEDYGRFGAAAFHSFHWVALLLRAYDGSDRGLWRLLLTHEVCRFLLSDGSILVRLVVLFTLNRTCGYEIKLSLSCDRWADIGGRFGDAATLRRILNYHISHVRWRSMFVLRRLIGRCFIRALRKLRARIGALLVIISDVIGQTSRADWAALDFWLVKCVVP